MKVQHLKIVPVLICAIWMAAGGIASAQFFDDFNGTQLDYSRWFIAEKQWGGNNNGVVHNNVTVSNGLLHLVGHGNNYTGSVAGFDGAPGQLVGAAIATTNYYASGSYQVRMKLPLTNGAASAIWPFHYEEAYSGDPMFSVLAQVGGLTFSNLVWIGLTTNQATSLVADLTSRDYIYPPTNGVYRTTDTFRGFLTANQMVLSNYYGYQTQIFVVLANAASLALTGGAYIRNEEIDIETPTTATGSSPITYAHDRFNTWVGQNGPEYTYFYDNIGYAFNDGQFHTYRIDWHTANPTVMSQRVEFYIDGTCYQTNYTHIPTIGGRFWVGYWFSDWSGTPNFDTQEMDVDWVQITPFNESGDQSVPETYPNEGWWTPSMKGNSPPAITGISPNVGTIAGGTVVTISGSNFFTGTTVQFGSSAPITATFSSNQTQLIVTAPTYAAGLVTVTVSNVDAKTGTTHFTFTPQGSTSSTTTLTRDAANPGTTSTYGTPLKFDINVSPSAATGTIDLNDAGTTIGTATLSGGACTITTAASALTLGIHTNLVAVYLGDANYSGSTSAALSFQTIQPLALTVSGAVANNKLYDGTTSATINGTLSGVISGDTVTFNGTGTFANAGPGTNIVVTSTSTLGGASATNYTLIQPTGLTANISAVFGISWLDASSGGDWSQTNNWSGGSIASGSGQTADFSELDITSPNTVHLDLPITIGNIIFGGIDTNIAAVWTVDNNGTAGNILTLASGGSRDITVTDPFALGVNATISAVIAGTNGLTKAGPGTLNLTGANTFTGGVTIANGTLNLANGAGDASTSDVYTLGSVTGGSASLFCGSAGTGNPITLTSNAVGTLMIGNNLAGSHPGFSGAINLNGQNLTVIANNGASGNTFLAGGVTGTGNLILTNASGSTATILVNAPGLNNTGTITLQGAATGGKFNLTGTIGTNVTALIYSSSNTPVIGSPAPTINVNNNGTAIISTSLLNLPTNSGITIGNTGGNLTLEANSTGSIIIGTIATGFAGSIINSGTGTGSGTLSSPIAGTYSLANIIQNSATSPLILSATNSYTNALTVSNGTLLVNGILGTAGANAASLIVASGGSLGGIGTINRQVVVQSGGSLAPGTNTAATIGTLTIASNVTLSGNLYFKLNKSLAASNDFVKISGTQTLTNTGVGTLTVSNIGPTLVSGDTFKLFSQPVSNGNVMAIVGPANFLNHLAMDGSIQVTTGNPAPSVTSLVPNSGRTNGGTLVTVNGANFVSGATVQFGAASPTAATFVNSSQLTATTPAHASGPVTVTVANPDTQTASSSFTYLAKPSPATGGAVVSGANLSLVWQGGANQNCLLLSATNATLPLAAWTVVATNVVGAGGLSTNLIPIPQGQGQRFYQLAIPYN